MAYDALIESDPRVIDEWTTRMPLPRWHSGRTLWAEPVLLRAGVYDVWVSKESLDEEPGFAIDIHASGAG